MPCNCGHFNCYSCAFHGVGYHAPKWRVALKPCKCPPAAPATDGTFRFQTCEPCNVRRHVDRQQALQTRRANVRQTAEARATHRARIEREDY